MITKRLTGAQVGLATLVIVGGSFASYAFGHALGQSSAQRGSLAHTPARVTSIHGLLGQAILSVPTQQQPASAPLAQAAPPTAAAHVSKQHGKGGHGKGGGDGGSRGGHQNGHSQRNP